MSISLRKENGLMLKKARSRQYPIEIITDADYADDQALLANIPVQAKSQLHSLEHATRGIGLGANSDKTEFIFFKQNGVIFTLNSKCLKLVDLFRYLSCNISSTENNINICIGRVWITVDKLLIT